MEFQEVISKRRSVREYKKQEISLSIIQEVLRVASLAPYPKLIPNWHSVIFYGQEKQKLNKMLLEYLLLKKEIGHSTHNSIKTCIKAPVLLLVFSKYISQENSVAEMLNNHSYVQSTGAYIQNILLSATNLGLGSLWVNDILFFRDEITSYVNESDQLVSGVLLGTPRIVTHPKNLTDREGYFYVFGE